MNSNKYENLKSLEKRKFKEKEKRNLQGSISFKRKMKDDIRHEEKLLKIKINLDKMVSKTQEDRISLEKLRKVKTQKISHSISPFEIKFSFNYFFSSLMPFKFRHLSFFF